MIVKYRRENRKDGGQHIVSAIGPHFLVLYAVNRDVGSQLANPVANDAAHSEKF